MFAGHFRERQVEFAPGVAVCDPRADIGEPVEIADRGFRADLHRVFDDRAGDFERIGLGHQRYPGAGDTGLLESDPAERFGRHTVFGSEQKRFVVDPQRGYSAHRLTLEHVGRIEPASQTDLDHAGIGRMAGEGEEGGGGGDLEETGRKVFARIQHLAQQRGEFGIAHQFSGNANPFVIAHQMRLGRGVDGVALRLENRAQICAGRAFAVGPGDVEHRGQAVLRVVEPLAQRADRLQPKAALWERKLR